MESATWAREPTRLKQPVLTGPGTAGVTRVLSFLLCETLCARWFVVPNMPKTTCLHGEASSAQLGFRSRRFEHDDIVRGLAGAGWRSADPTAPRNSWA